MITVQIHETKQQLRLTVGDGTSFEVSIPDAVELSRDIIDAVSQCGFEVKMNVEVPKHVPSAEQLNAAVHRVAHLRKSFDSTPWNDVRANRELVQRVLEACL